MSTALTPEKLDYAVLEQAAEWFALFESEQVDDQQRHEWQLWLEADDKNRRAWTQVENINLRFESLPPKAASKALNESETTRRQLLKNLVLVAAVGGVLWQTARWQNLGASHRTGRGEIAEFRLQDGTSLWLNTASAVQLSFNATQRQVELLDGEILIDTATDARPFFVETHQGRLQALGTRFSVRDSGAEISLAVEEGAVAIQRHPGAEPVLIEQGYATRFSRDAVQPVVKIQSNNASWVRNMIVADEMPLGEFIDELNRYYSGYINVSPGVADLKLVGAYPLNDVDRVLSAIEQSHPVSLSQVTPWWRSVQPKK